jgi:hypothetical protein
VQQQQIYDVIFHADWSIKASKRWVAVAHRDGSAWQITQLSQITDLIKDHVSLARLLLETARDKRVLAGFDFPIGVPAKWASAMELKSFPDFLERLRDNNYPSFCDVARSASEICLQRPFYPASAKAGVKQQHLYKALGFQAFDELRRRCEGPTQHRAPASPLFWTLGAKQVGKGALSGWREVITPCVNEGARLWPFDGDLENLSASSFIIAETYPAEIYGWLGIKFQGKGGKRSQAKRREFIQTIRAYMEKGSISLSKDVTAQLEDGFGAAADGEDRFDAFCGACGMIEVANGCRAAGAPRDPYIRNFEGWILGQKAEDILSG